MDEFFRGFVRTKDKHCIDKFKGVPDHELYTYDEVKDLPEFAGILADDAVLIDVDDEPQSEILLDIVDDLQLNCRVYKSRSGMHFLFKNDGRFNRCKTKTSLACGLVDIDIKSGKSNSYEVLKIAGKERDVVYDIFEDEEYQIAPKFLLPVKTKTKFKELKAGDGRNQELFNYILTLQSNDFEVEEARECIKIMNKYILPEALDENEIDTILRDEAFNKPIFFKGQSFLFDKFAVFIKNNHHVKRINGQLHMYKDGIYVSGLEDIQNKMIEHIPNLSKARRNEVLAYLDILIREDTPQAAPNLIAFRNGILNINTGELSGFSPDIVITNKIPWDYNPSAYWKATDEVLNNVSCGDKKIRLLLEEAAGYTFLRRNELGKAFFLTGSGRNGKSTYFNMLKQMLGKDNRSSLDMKMLGDRFSTILMYNKLANIGDDISDEFLADASIFKKIATGESIGAEQKGQPKFEFEPYTKLFFSANSIPRIGKGKDSAAILRRLVIVPFNAKFDKNNGDYNSYIWDDIKGQESMEYLIKLGVEGLKRVLANQGFTESEAVQEEMDDFETTNNPVIGFFKDTESNHILNNKTKDVYGLYTKYCYENSLQAISAGEFSKQVKKYFECKIVSRRINGEMCRLFVKEGE